MLNINLGRLSGGGGGVHFFFSPIAMGGTLDVKIMQTGDYKK